MIYPDFIIEKKDSQLKKYKFQNGIMNIVDPKINILTFRNILYLIKEVSDFETIKEIFLNFESKSFQDQTSILILEYILYFLIANNDLTIKISFNELDKSHNLYDIFNQTTIFRCIDNFVLNNKDFIELFEEEFYKKQIIRKFIGVNKFIDHKDRKKCPSNILQQMNRFLNENRISRNVSENISQVISEIVDNILSHSEGNAVLFVSIGNNINNEIKNRLINVSILNYSGPLISTLLKDKHVNNSLNQKSKEIIDNALKYHNLNFNDYYDEDSFYFISAFQKNVSIRNLSNNGRGLPFLVKVLKNNAHKDESYIISGKDKLILDKNYLNLKSDGTIGFNESNDFYTDIPSFKLLKRNDFHFNANAYNLVFVD